MRCQPFSLLDAGRLPSPNPNTRRGIGHLLYGRNGGASTRFAVSDPLTDRTLTSRRGVWRRQRCSPRLRQARAQAIWSVCSLAATVGQGNPRDGFRGGSAVAVFLPLASDLSPSGLVRSSSGRMYSGSVVVPLSGEQHVQSRHNYYTGSVVICIICKLLRIEYTIFRCQSSLSSGMAGVGVRAVLIAEPEEVWICPSLWFGKDPPRHWLASENPCGAKICAQSLLRYGFCCGFCWLSGS